MKKTDRSASPAVQRSGDLQKIRTRMKPYLSVQDSGTTTRVVVGLGTCGLAAGAQQVFDAMKAELERLGLENVQIIPTGCVGICQLEPVVEVYVPGQARTTYVKMTPERGVRVVRQHLQGGNPLAEFTIGSKS